jgi:lipopolysaccharide export system permease protein
MKKLHLFILRSYLEPLTMTFFISLFILVMQFLWRYVDDLVGKGLEWGVLGELMFFASLQVVPMALPLAILLASLMTFGNMGENYELTALKSAGVSLLRIMMPLIIFTGILSVGAYKFSNNLLPVATLKLTSILSGIRETRLELDIKEKVFYQGVEDFSIKIDRKDNEKKLLYDVMIYDHRDRHARNSNVTIADSGKLQMSTDKKFLQLTLFDGIRYDDRVSGEASKKKQKDSRMFRTDYFKEQQAIIQLEGFDFSKTDESLLRNIYKMKNRDQLTHDLDSIRGERRILVKTLEQRSSSFYFSRLRYEDRSSHVIIDTARAVNADSLFNALEDNQKPMVMEYALRQARDNKQAINDQMRFIGREELSIRHHLVELHRKFTLSFACLIFFFIGAPLGAIIRKGGLGMPVVISVLFFVIYYVIDTMGLKFAKEGLWPVYQGMWLSSAILLPVGAFLTYKSATDSALLNADAYINFFRKMLGKFKFTKKTADTPA